MCADSFQHPERFPDPADPAVRIVPAVIGVVGDVRSVVDLGGGTGAWCRAFLDAGVPTVRCVDDPGMDRRDLRIPESSFIPHDLSKSLPPPIPCDLAMSLEVAEHLPRERSAQVVEFLVSCAPVVLFGASRPGQPGFGHINEQPARFWREQFARVGYEELDLLRPRIADDATLPYWYRQNAMFYANRERGGELRARAIPFARIPEDFELVSERLLAIYRTPPPPPTVGRLLRALPGAIRRSIQSRFGRGS